LARLRDKAAGTNAYQVPHDYIQCLPIIPSISQKKPKKTQDSCSLAKHSGTLPSKKVQLDHRLPLKGRNVAYNYEEDNVGFGHDQDQSEQEPAANITVAGAIDTKIVTDWREYCVRQEKYFVPLGKKQRKAIRLMAELRTTKASLDTYDAIMEWHLKETGELRRHESMGQTYKFLSRQKLFKDLRERYNTTNKYSLVKKLVLPSSKARVNVVYNDARAVLQSLLTDPNIRDEDYLFFNDDPFAPPPDKLDYIADLNTGLSYTATYKKLITKPGKQILFPCVKYADGCATGQFTALSITAVKLGNGLLTRKARDKAYAWRILGYIPEVFQQKSRGRRQLLESGHVDGVMAHQDATTNEGDLGTNPACKAQDFHTLLDAVLEGFVELQNTGFIFDFQYKGILYKDVEFIPFVPFFKCDTDEADRLCGAFTSRGWYVAHLCRYCHCPTCRSDQPNANYNLKTVTEIKGLVAEKNTKQLQAISQQNIQNATYSLRFGLHNDQGIHGATPMDMLHALLLGIFKYIRDCFFEQIGPTSKLADEIDAMAREYGELLTRQSDRDKPKTMFGGGIRKGKLTAKEYPGLLLCMATILRSTAGRKLLRSGQSSVFTESCVLNDWSLLVETMLQWETWLKKDRMNKKLVVRTGQKHRYLMYLIKKVGRRTKGMGLKTVKFHAIMHMVDDMLNFGVPMEYDTGSNESGHKPTKTAAKLTQKCPETFDKQTSERLEEVDLIGLAMAEIEGRPLWDYPLGYMFLPQQVKKIPEPSLGGAKFHCFYDQRERRNQVNSMIDFKCDIDLTLEDDLVDFVVQLQNAVKGFNKIVYLRTNHYRNGQIFRGHVHLKGGVWRDWVIVDWDDDGKIPNKIWGFVDLSWLPEDSGINYGGLTSLEPGLYAIVESSEYSKPTKQEVSELFVPFRKEIRGIRNGFVTGMKFYLADCEAIIDTAIVIPDIGGQPNAYFLLRNRTEWGEIFEKWLAKPHTLDEISDDEEEDEEDAEESSEEGQESGDESEDSDNS